MIKLPISPFQMFNLIYSLIAFTICGMVITISLEFYSSLAVIVFFIVAYFTSLALHDGLCDSYDKWIEFKEKKK